MPECSVHRVEAFCFLCACRILISIGLSTFQESAGTTERLPINLRPQNTINLHSRATYTADDFGRAGPSDLCLENGFPVDPGYAVATTPPRSAFGYPTDQRNTFTDRESPDLKGYYFATAYGRRGELPRFSAHDRSGRALGSTEVQFLDCEPSLPDRAASPSPGDILIGPSDGRAENLCSTATGGVCRHWPGKSSASRQTGTRSKSVNNGKPAYV